MTEKRYNEGGMSVKTFELIRLGLAVYGFREAHREHTPYGDIYVAERQQTFMQQWEVYWITRDMARKIEMPFWTDPTTRRNEAVSDALKVMQRGEEVRGKAIFRGRPQ